MRTELSYTIIYIHFTFVHSLNTLISQFGVKSIVCVCVYKYVNISFPLSLFFFFLQLSHVVTFITFYFLYNFLFFLELIIASGFFLVVC